MLIPNYTYWFQRYLRRPLTPVESAIITRLERQRSHGGRIRIIIDDPHADTDPTIRDLLTLYLQWLNRRLYPNLTAAISAPHLPEARRAARTISPDTLYTSGRSADSLRGHTFHLALMLDAHRYPQRDLYHLARNTRIPDSQLPACWQGKPLRDLPPRDSFESVFHTLVGGPTYYLEPPHKKPIPNSKFLIPNLSKLLPFHNRPWYIDPKQRPPHATHIEHLDPKTHSIGARATRGEGILPSYKKHKQKNVNKPERGHLALVHPRTTHAPKVSTDLKVLKVLPLLHNHQKEGKMPSLRPPPTAIPNS